MRKENNFAGNAAKAPVPFIKTKYTLLKAKLCKNIKSLCGA